MSSCHFVLIVAKCIVNAFQNLYCLCFALVLIVAKCIVNTHYKVEDTNRGDVLIVAKCIVNTDNLKKLATFMKY